ncbi:MAG: GDP-mannose 4,6-dehydratase [Lachnospiraceae bacterium]|nr:GDP-mannose 4,6-dehydratase [Lachnospiraceae bacterium]
MKLLINGGCGFLGSNLASYAIENGYEVTVFDNMSRIGSDRNREWLQSLGNFNYIHGDTRNKNDVENVIKEGQFDAIFHLAGQVTMTKSILDPYKDFEINAMGAMNVLDSIRKYSPQTSIIFSSTNKVYGDLEYYTYEETPTRYVCKEFPNGFDESVPLDFRSPYGCSKGCADQYMLDFSRIFGIKSVVFRHSSMYGSRQFATYDQGWVGWFVAKAIEKYKNPACEPFTISGNGKQVRDLLQAQDMINLYFTALEHIDDIYGQAYNIGGTMDQSLSLLELFAKLEDILGIKMEYTELPPRQSDQKVFVADISKIKNKIGWEPKVTAIEGVTKMVDWVKEISK